jgi:hypothetical protein
MQAQNMIRDLSQKTLTQRKHLKPPPKSSILPCVNISDCISPEKGVDLVSVLNKFADGINYLSTTMNQMREDVNEKIDKVAEEVERKLSHKFSNMFDKRIKTEIVKNKKEIDISVKEVRDELNTDIDCLQQQIDKITENQNNQNGSRNLVMNICIVNHPHRENENLSHLVSDLFIEGLRMRDIEFTTAVRKNGSDGKPGVIIVTMKTVEDKDKVLKNKNILKNNPRYRNVYINKDQSAESRVNSNNLKLLVSSLGISVLKVRGNRLFFEDQNSDRNNGNDQAVNTQSSHYSRRNNSQQKVDSNSAGHNNPRDDNIQNGQTSNIRETSDHRNSGHRANQYSYSSRYDNHHVNRNRNPNWSGHSPAYRKYSDTHRGENNQDYRRHHDSRYNRRDNYEHRDRYSRNNDNYYSNYRS